MYQFLIVKSNLQLECTTNERQQQLPFTSWIGSKRLLSEQGDEYETVTKSDDHTDIDRSSRVEDGEDEAATDRNPDRNATTLLNEKAENKEDNEKNEFVDTAIVPRQQKQIQTDNLIPTNHQKSLGQRDSKSHVQNGYHSSYPTFK